MFANAMWGRQCRMINNERCLMPSQLMLWQKCPRHLFVTLRFPSCQLQRALAKIEIRRPVNNKKIEGNGAWDLIVRMCCLIVRMCAKTFVSIIYVNRLMSIIHSSPVCSPTNPPIYTYGTINRSHNTERRQNMLGVCDPFCQ